MASSADNADLCSELQVCTLICDAVLSHSHGGRDRTFVLGPCLDRLVRIAMAIELRVEREREVEVDMHSSWRARYGIRRPREVIT